MKPEHEDPNNHAPEVLPDDGWDDEDPPEEQIPLKQDFVVPPKREERVQGNLGFKGRHVTRYEPKSQSDLDAPSDGPGESGPSKKEASGGRVPGKKKSEHQGKSLSGSSNLPPVKPTPIKGRSKKSPVRSLEVIPNPEEEAANETIEKVTLPVSSGSSVKHRVHEISRVDPTPANLKSVPQIPEKVTPSQVEEAKQEAVGRQRRQFVAGERGDWGEQQGGRSAGWMIYTGIGVISLIVLSVILSQKFGKTEVRESDKSLYSQLEIADEIPEAAMGTEMEDSKQIELLNISQKNGQELYARYAKAESVADFADFMFDRTHVEPIAKAAWSPVETRSDWKVDDSARWFVADEDGNHYAMMSGRNDDFSEFTAFFQIEGGELKLDWKATAAYSSASYEDLKEGKGDPGEIRGYLSKADFFTFALPEEKFHSFRLMSPNRLHTVWIYSEIDSELDQKLVKMFGISPITGQAQNEVQLTLSLERGPAESLPGQWMIKDLTGLSWMDR
ncbi:hypothetical protein ACFSSA_14615 [Luteolibacter algae]|uniref:Uncharacterized protein n=1 Tax=Luteolibacter algae TaxID=454151 RepID=A0ABW5DD05_9BACT